MSASKAAPPLDLSAIPKYMQAQTKHKKMLTHT